MMLAGLTTLVCGGEQTAVAIEIAWSSALRKSQARRLALMRLWRPRTSWKMRCTASGTLCGWRMHSIIVVRYNSVHS